MRPRVLLRRTRALISFRNNEQLQSQFSHQKQHSHFSPQATQKVNAWDATGGIPQGRGRDATLTVVLQVQ